MNSIEEKLWNYIDGACTAEEQKATGLLIEQDEVYRRKYQELLKLNRKLAAMELDEPSMAFTYNVMETIRAENAKVPLKAAIDKRIIQVIGAFFIITILALLIFILASVNWHTGGPALNINLSVPDIAQYFTGNFIEGFLFFDMVLALFLFDAYLRKKAFAKTNMTVPTNGQQGEQKD